MINAGTIRTAANIRTGSSSSVSLEDFLAVFPQFSHVPQAFLDIVLADANAAISEKRWHSKRTFAVCLYVAHHATLWLKTAAGLDENSSPSAVSAAGESHGAVSSKSVGGVSVSYGAAEGISDLAGYGAWKETEFGIQLATMAKLVGTGIVVVR